MKPGLMDKLRMIDADAKAKEAMPAPEPQALPEDGAFHFVKTDFPLSIFCNRRFSTPENMSKIFREAYPPSLTEKDFLFLDTETTGLSGGAGTIAFQVGLGYFDADRFVVEQFLIRDYHEEAAMLTALLACCARFSVIVTFNGKAFDIPLLKNRLIMHRKSAVTLPVFQADVLHPARRLWKLRLGSCTLSRLEAALLGIEREDDLPGALVPQAYFQYLRDRNFAPMERVLQHNQQDIVSLAQLFFFLCLQCGKPEEIKYTEDMLSLANTLQKDGHTADAVKCYRLSAKGTTRPQALNALAICEKKKGHPENAIRLYAAMARCSDDPAVAYEALAKLAEHQKKDILQALHYTRQALLFLAEPKLFPDEAVQSRRIALQYRYARLLRKKDPFQEVF